MSANVKRGKLSAKIQRFRKRLDEGRVSGFVRRRPAAAAWAGVFLMAAGLAQVWGPSPRPEFVPDERQRCVEKMARGAVERSLKVIGHGVKVSSVTVSPMEWYKAASYRFGSAEVRFNPDVGFTADEVLWTAAHESVHALFDQAELRPLEVSLLWESRLLIEEMTAAVLGAHIAGRVRTLQGGDGESLTRLVIENYRRNCSFDHTGRRGRIWAVAHRSSLDRADWDFLKSVSIHYGPVELVDAIDRICQEHPDPWDAAHVVAERYIEPIEE